MESIPRRLAGWDQGLERDVVVLFHEGDEVGVVVVCNHENTLPRVPRLVRMGQNVQQPSGLDRDHYALERNAPFNPQRFVLFRTPAKRLHALMLRSLCAYCHHSTHAPLRNGLSGCSGHVIGGSPLATGFILMHSGTGHTIWHRLQPTHSSSITVKRRPPSGRWSKRIA